MKKEREIVIEVERVRTVFCRVHSRQEWCAECQREVDFLTVVEAAALSETSVQKIFACAEIGALHTANDSDSKLLVCLNSLLGTSFI